MHTISRKRLLTVLTVLSGCYGEPLSTREKGALAGGALGAGTGAIVGSTVGAPGAGAAIGGAIGAGIGMLIGNELQNTEIVQTRMQSQLYAQQNQIARQRVEIEHLRLKDPRTE